MADINFEKYKEALNNIMSTDSTHHKGDEDVDALAELIMVANKLDNRIKKLESEHDALIKNYSQCMKDYAKEIFDDIEGMFEPTVSSIFLISETLVDVSKSYIDADRAIIDIRKYLGKAIGSRYQLKKALEKLRNKYIGEVTNE